MAFSLKTKAGGDKPAKKSTKKKTDDDVEDESPPKKKKKKSAKANSASGAAAFLHSGKKAAEMMKRDEEIAKTRKENANKAWQFRMKPGDDAYVTFVDGELDDNTGILDILYANIHRVKVGGNWEDVLCIEEQEPCPLCNAGEKKSFCGFLTVIDHRKRKYEKNGKNVVVKATKRLFTAKTSTLKTLNKLAEKRDNGLVGSTYEVSRTGDFKPAVGDIFEHNSTHDLDEIEEEFGEDMVTPIVYSEELLALSAKEMKKMGLGETTKSFGSSNDDDDDDDEEDDDGVDGDDIDDNDSPW